MLIVGKRLRALRESIGVSQAKMAELIHSQQPSIARYETDQTDPSAEVLLRYADYFDVSMDYIFGRTDKPQGERYEYEQKRLIEKPELKQFIEMCFDPDSPMSTQLKEILYSMMLQEGNHE